MDQNIIECKIKEKNNKLKMIGKGQYYLMYKGKGCIDIGKVEIEKLVVPEFVSCIINSNNNEINNTILEIEFRDNLRYIQPKAFRNLTKLKKVSNLDNILNLDTEELFCYCKSLRKAPILPKYIESLIETFAFCESLVEVEIPRCIKLLNGTFRGCKSLKIPTILPDGIESLNYVFEGCESLEESPIIPDSVKEMICTFNGCVKLKNVAKLPINLITMDGTFFNCNMIEKSPIIPNNVQCMTSVFDSCFSMIESPVIPERVTNLKGTFSSCTKLKKAPIIPKSVTNLEKCFYQCYSLTGELTIESDNIECSEECLFEASINKDSELIINSKNKNYGLEILKTKSKESNIYINGVKIKESKISSTIKNLGKKVKDYAEIDATLIKDAVYSVTRPLKYLYYDIEDLMKRYKNNKK